MTRDSRRGEQFEAPAAHGSQAGGRPYLNTQQAAHYLGIGWRKLMRLRVAGEGPVFRLHGRLIVYHPRDLDAWSQSTARKARP